MKNYFTTEIHTPGVLPSYVMWGVGSASGGSGLRLLRLELFAKILPKNKIARSISI